MKHLRGITLIELLLSLTLTIFVGAAVVSAYHSALRFGPNIAAANEANQKQIALEDRLRSILSHAWINTSATDQTTYFTTNPQQPTNTVATGSTGTTTTGTVQNSSNSSTNGAPGGGADTLVFTSLGLPTNRAALYNDDDFETNNTNRGPAGGAIEYGLSLQPVGNAQGQKGVFLREQKPADTDPTQGGYETLLIPDIDTLSFEFWDGTSWETSWDTPNMTPKRIPAAVRVTYSTNGNNQRSFIVVLVNSDVTPANPVSSTGSTTTTTSTTGGGA